MKDVALKIIEAALVIYPPLASLFRKWVAGEPIEPDDTPLVDEIAARIPEQSESAKVAREIGGS